ncbi:hypothetical protein [Clostridium thermarum]|uniref:hypothetical protein n=1 Tax=Clostridium thermarum TaxID=1716543 RepID=UPI00111D9BCD|nr:hypothetical protein [Clostridium thermarum]
MGENLKRVIEKLNKIEYLEVSGQVYWDIRALDRENLLSLSEVACEMEDESRQVKMIQEDCV